MVDNLIWRERKKTWFRMPWTFTVYGLSEDRLFVDSGLLVKKYRDVRLYRVLDIGVKRSLIQRLFGLGSVTIQSQDADLGNFSIENIFDCERVKELIADRVEEERKRNKVSAREWFGEDEIGI